MGENLIDTFLVQIPSNEYHHPRPVTHPQPTSTITTTPSNLQVRAHNYARNPTSVCDNRFIGWRIEDFSSSFSQQI